MNGGEILVIPVAMVVNHSVNIDPMQTISIWQINNLMQEFPLNYALQYSGWNIAHNSFEMKIILRIDASIDFMELI